MTCTSHAAPSRDARTVEADFGRCFVILKAIGDAAVFEDNFAADHPTLVKAAFARQGVKIS